MGLGDKRRLGGKQGRRRRQGGKGKTKAETTGRASQPTIECWGFDAVGVDGSIEEIREIGIRRGDTEKKSKREKKR